MVQDIKSDIETNDITIFLIPNSGYAQSVLKISKAVSGFQNRICYVSLNKPYTTMVKEFEKNGINTKKFVFIDCVGKGSSGGDVFYVSSPKALTELNIMISKVISGGTVNSVLFDSLSTMLIYEESSTVIKFAHSVISALRSKGTKAVFTCLKDDVKSELIKDLGMFVDKIEELE